MAARATLHVISTYSSGNKKVLAPLQHQQTVYPMNLTPVSDRLRVDGARARRVDKAHAALSTNVVDVEGCLSTVVFNFSFCAAVIGILSTFATLLRSGRR